MNTLNKKNVQTKKSVTSSDKHTTIAVEQDGDHIRGGLYQGPIPPPNIMAGYGEINPSFPERIMQEFEKNSEHIRNMNETALKGDISRDRIGQIFAFVLAAGLLGLVYYSLSLGNVTFAGLAGVGVLLTMIPPFLPKCNVPPEHKK